MVSSGGSLSPEIVKLELKLAEDPRSKVFIPLAEEYIKAGMLQEAIAILEDGLKVYPTFLTARVALGRAYHQVGRVQEAKAMLEEAVKHSPDNLLAHRTLARIYAEEEAYDLALRSCAVVLGANPKDEDILTLKERIDRGACPTQEGRDGSEGEAPAIDAVSRTVARLQTMLARIRQRRAS
jgi:tetratricopeptide (TPR) repeat protein